MNGVTGIVLRITVHIRLLVRKFNLTFISLFRLSLGDSLLLLATLNDSVKESHEEDSKQTKQDAENFKH